MFPLIIYFLNATFLQSVLNPSSEQADKIYRLFNYSNIVAGAMLLLVIFLVFYISIKYPRKSGDSDGSVQARGNNKLEALMVVVPALLLAFFFFHTVNAMRGVPSSVDAERQPDVIIIGQQWCLEAEYPEMNVVTANEVNLPVGKKLLMEMRSEDVVHNWWVSELGNKMDLVPNIKNYNWLDINKPGTYHRTSSEFCSVQHNWMRIKMIAQQRNEFTQWLKENKNKNFRGLDGSF